MNEEIQYYESLPNILMDCENTLIGIITTLEIDGRLPPGVERKMRETSFQLTRSLIYYAEVRLNELYARQDSDMPSAPTFTAGDQ